MASPDTHLWPSFSSTAFAPTRYLLHRITQVMGKLELNKPFQAEWSEVPLLVTARGLSTGLIPYADGMFDVGADFLAHRLTWRTSNGTEGELPLGPTSVADFVKNVLAGLAAAGVHVDLDMVPQEVTDPIRFDEDTQERPFDKAQVEAWWRILLSCQRVFERFQGNFTGKTQPIGLMWGTFDFRLALYNGKPAAPAPGSSFIRRNAMNAELMELGWWSGDDSAEAGFFAFTYPQPQGIETAQVRPHGAAWSTSGGEFAMSYETVRAATDPDAALLAFLESTYEAGARAAHWDPALIGSGQPV